MTLLTSFALACLCSSGILYLARLHAHRFGDHDFVKPQKVHTHVVPRIGGLGVFLGVLAGVLLGLGKGGEDHQQMGLQLLACALPAFLTGFVQDFTDAISPKGRLVATACSAALAHVVLDAVIQRTSLPGLDWVVGFGAGALVLTVFTVAGIANAVNIIDGLNGLASMCVILMLGAICHVAYEVSDPWVGRMALAGIGAVLGFFVWNYPRGLIFLGDGGAYFLGFYVAELAILLLVRNPQVSPMFPLLACIYPVFETLFSIYRRMVLRGRPPQMPDGVHLHTLVYRRMMRWVLGRKPVAYSLTRRNSMSSPLLWLLCMVAVVPAMVFWDNTPVLLGFIGLFALTYIRLYRRFVLFRVPRWLRRVSRPRSLRRRIVVRSR